jgi:hypothetical protein
MTLIYCRVELQALVYWLSNACHIGDSVQRLWVNNRRVSAIASLSKHLIESDTFVHLMKILW